MEIADEETQAGRNKCWMWLDAGRWTWTLDVDSWMLDGMTESPFVTRRGYMYAVGLDCLSCHHNHIISPDTDSIISDTRDHIIIHDNEARKNGEVAACTGTSYDSLVGSPSVPRPWKLRVALSYAGMRMGKQAVLCQPPPSFICLSSCS